MGHPEKLSFRCRPESITYSFTWTPASLCLLHPWSCALERAKSYFSGFPIGFTHRPLQMTAPPRSPCS